MHAPVYDDQGNVVTKNICPFCRVPVPNLEKDIVEGIKKRVEFGDPQAIYNLGCHYRDGIRGYPQDYDKAFELYHRAGKLGNARGYSSIGCAYHFGEGAEADKKKAMHYWELAAVGGDVQARHNLGSIEAGSGNYNRALKHYMISIGSGKGESLDTIKEMYSVGQATKDDYTKALQSYQTYLGEIKSDQRDKAAAFSERYRYY